MPPSSTDSKPDSALGFRQLLFRLEMEPQQFEPQADLFIDSLTNALGLAPSQAHILWTRPGCTEVAVEFRDVQAGVIRFLLRVYRGEVAAPEIEEFLSRFATSHVTELSELEAPFINQLTEEARILHQEGPWLTWLHLSDLHANSGDAAIYQSQVSERLIAAVANGLAYYGRSPDWVFFTGDLAAHARSDEYVNVGMFLDELADKLGTSPELFAVPGNHDVDWNAVDAALDDELDERLESHSAVSTFLGGSGAGILDERRRVLRRTRNFRQFIRKRSSGIDGPPRRAGVGAFALRQIGSTRIGIAQFDSAWRSTTRRAGKRVTDPEALLLGALQADDLNRAVCDVDLRIALIHHPPGTSWFRGFEKSGHAELLKEYQVILHGHEHNLEYGVFKTFSATDTQIRVAGGAMYSGSAKQALGVNALTLNLATGDAVGFCWRFFEDRLRWAPDSTINGSGRIFMRLPGLQATA